MGQTILLIGGSLNQTTMMHQIASQLTQFNCYFSPFYVDSWLNSFRRRGLLDFTILGGRHLQNSMAFMAENKLPIDYGGQARSYDLVITCSDLIIQQNIRDKRLILVQEGMTEPENLLYHLVRRFKLPRYLANTAVTGLSNAYDLFCVASEGYRNLFIRKGVHPGKIAVTGIPNFDHAEAYQQNDFPYRDFVLVATSSIRETYKYDNRLAFIQRAFKIADGRQLIFKLHPNENFTRAIREIRTIVPGAMIFTAGNVNHMIANCSVLITQTSSVVYIGLALGKETYSYFDIQTLRHLLPIQNSGASARHIADLCRQLIHIPQDELLAARTGHLHHPVWKLPSTT